MKKEKYPEDSNNETEEFETINIQTNTVGATPVVKVKTTMC